MKQLPGLGPSTAEGEVVVVSGTVRAIGEPLIAPLSRARCAWFESRANTFERRGAQRFLLEREGTSPIVIDPTHAHVALALLPQSAVDTFPALEIRIAHRDTDGLATAYETIVAIGAAISVAGIVARETAAETPYRDARADILLVGNADAPLVIVDT